MPGDVASADQQKLVPSFLLTFEDGRLLLRVFYGKTWLFHIGQEASTVSLEMAKVEVVVAYLRECLYEAASAETVRCEREAR